MEGAVQQNSPYNGVLIAMSFAIDPYSLLGISEGLTREEAYKQYRRKVKETHPDVCSDPNATERFMLIKKAWQFLEDNGEFRSNAHSEGAHPDYPHAFSGFTFVSSRKAFILFSAITNVPLTATEYANLRECKRLVREGSDRIRTYKNYGHAVLHYDELEDIADKPEWADVRVVSADAQAQFICELNEKICYILKFRLAGYSVKKWLEEAELLLKAIASDRGVRLDR